jgi:hypothetical protein
MERSLLENDRIEIAFDHCFILKEYFKRASAPLLIN